MSQDGAALDSLLHESRRFPPPEAFRAAAVVSDEGIFERAAADPEAFWEEWAGELHWFRKWDRVLEWNPPHARWFDGGRLNAAYNCLDRHLDGPRRNKAALIWEGEPGDTRTYTYWDLHREVSKFANVLKGLGVARGDRVAIYLPMVPEAAIAMLACARIGAPHSVVFGGFSPEALADRINDAGARVVLTAEGAVVPGPSGDQLAKALRRHGLDVEAVALQSGKGHPGQVILDHAEKIGCDLLIKGAYTQSRIRQMIFGGATSHILANARIPVFMAH